MSAMTGVSKVIHFNKTLFDTEYATFALSVNTCCASSYQT